MPVEARARRFLITINVIVGVIVVVLGVCLLAALVALRSSLNDSKAAVDALKTTSERTECARYVSSTYNEAMWSDVANALYYSLAETRDPQQVTAHVRAMVERPGIATQTDEQCPPPVADTAAPTSTPTSRPSQSTVICDTGDGIATTDEESADQIGC